MPGFSIGEAVQFGWNTMKANLGFFIGALIIAFVIQLAPEIIGDVLKEDAPVAAAVAYVISVIVQMVITMGFIRISLRLCDNDRADLADLFTCFPLFFKYLAGSILYALIILGGLILLIVPGIIWAIKFQFFSYFIIDRELGPIEALKRSSDITNGVKGTAMPAWENLLSEEERWHVINFIRTLK